jgi:hypothetical protein
MEKTLLVVGSLLLLGAAFLLTNCAGASAEVKLYSPTLGCELPPVEHANFVQVFCEEAENGDIGCGYVGWLEGELCFDLIVSHNAEHCSGEWELNTRVCGIKAVPLPTRDTRVLVAPQPKREEKTL